MAAFAKHSNMRNIGIFGFFIVAQENVSFFQKHMRQFFRICGYFARVSAFRICSLGICSHKCGIRPLIFNQHNAYLIRNATGFFLF